MLLFLSFTIGFGAGCDSDSGTESDAPKLRMTVDTDNLKPLQDGFTYKVWAKVGFEYYSTEGFNVTETGQFLTQVGEFRDKSFVLDADLTDAEVVFITVEGKSSTSNAPSKSIVMAADVTGNVSQLSSSHSLALGGSIAGQSGQLTILTTSDVDTSNDEHGVWFLTVSNGVMSPGLSLPTLNEGWKYEGWVDVGGHRFTTGKFVSNTRNDEFQPHSYNDVPLFPGEDFLLNPPDGVVFPLNLSGAVVTITVEPNADDSFDPYGIKVLSATLPASIQAGSVHPLTSANAVFPTASVTIF